jgi:hypothetical protein
MSDIKKRDVIGTETDVGPEKVDFSDIDEKRLLRKIDLNVVPWCVLVGGVSRRDEPVQVVLPLFALFRQSRPSFSNNASTGIAQLDRTSIGNARLYGLQADIGATDSD